MADTDSVEDDDYPIIDFNPYSVPSNYLKALGLVTSASAQTEAVVEMAIAACLGLDAEFGWAVTTHMNSTMRDSVLRSAAEIRIDDLDALDRLDVILDTIRSANERRNEHVHNQVGVRPDGSVISVKVRARSRVETDVVAVPIHKIKEDAQFIYAAGLELMQFLLDNGLEPALPPAARPRGHKSKAARKARLRSTSGK